MASSTDNHPVGEASNLLSLKPEETAFIFIEYQNEFTSPGGKLYDAVKACLEKTNMLENSSNLLNAVRTATTASTSSSNKGGYTILHCPISFEPGHDEIAVQPYGILSGIKDGKAFTAGEWNSEFYDPMRPQAGELVVKGKSGLCGFMSTNLDFLLRQSKCQNIVLCGFLANCCVESTMRTGYEKGYTVYTVKDCVAATSVEAMDATIEYNYGMFSVVTTSTDLINSIQNEAGTPVASY
jgi:nicotinamidase-related amidase